MIDATTPIPASIVKPVLHMMAEDSLMKEEEEEEEAPAMEWSVTQKGRKTRWGNHTSSRSSAATEGMVCRRHFDDVLVTHAIVRARKHG